MGTGFSLEEKMSFVKSIVFRKILSIQYLGLITMPHLYSFEIITIISVGFPDRFVWYKFETL